MIPAEFPWRHELLGAAWVALGFGLVFAGVELWRRWGRPQVEWTRKAAHVGAGVVVCLFPWIFESPWSVAALCAVFFALLLLARLARLLPSVQGVERFSLGELLYPLGVAGLSFLSWGRPAEYLAPMLALVVSDAFAALVGKTFARMRYAVDDGESKSFEGSAVFFFFSFSAFVIPVTFFGAYDPRVVILVGLQWAFLVTCFEAISLSGVDNLVLPIGGWYLMTQMIQYPLPWALTQIAGQGLCLALAATAVWRYRFLSFSALIAAQLYLYGAFAYGGPDWLAGPLLCAAIFFLARRGPHARQAGGQARVQVLAFYYAVLPSTLVYVLYNFSVVFGPGLPGAGIVRSWACRGIFDGLLVGLLASAALCIDLPAYLRRAWGQALGKALASAGPLIIFLCAFYAWSVGPSEIRGQVALLTLSAVLSFGLFAWVIRRWPWRGQALGQARLIGLCGILSAAVIFIALESLARWN